TAGATGDGRRRTGLLGSAAVVRLGQYDQDTVAQHLPQAGGAQPGRRAATHPGAGVVGRYGGGSGPARRSGQPPGTPGAAVATHPAAGWAPTGFAHAAKDRKSVV